MNDLVSAVEQNISGRELLSPGGHFLVAVSGGADSMVLLHALHLLAQERRWKITVAHFNHRLRGKESDGDERLVKTAAKKLGIKFVAGRWKGERSQAIREFGLEMAARNARHQFLGETAKRFKISTVVLAHHADDQVELFLMRLLRGAGGEGLAGMKWSGPMMRPYSRIRLVRPLLDLSKSELNEFAREHGIVFREDSSNQHQVQLRNRIRLELIPLLKRKYEPALNRTILRTMEIVGSDADFVAQSARVWLEQQQREPFPQLHPALQRQCLRLQLEQKGLPMDFALIETLRAKPNETVAVSPEYQVVCDENGIVTASRISKIEFESAEVPLSITDGFGEVSIDGVKVKWRRENLKGDKLPAKPKHGVEFFDADKVGAKIILRYWRPGDRFQPIGMTREVKLQDLFTNLKIPRSERHQLLVATTAEGRLFWVERVRISEQFKLDNTTTCRLKWQWLRGSVSTGRYTGRSNPA